MNADTQRDLQGIVQNLSNTASQAKLVIFSGPSGCGKGTLWRCLAEEYKTLYQRQSYYTTRPMRRSDEGDSEYKFVALEDLRILSQRRLFVLQPIYDSWQGIDVEEVDHIFHLPKLTILEVGRLNALHLARLYPAAQTVFLLPLSVNRFDATEWSSALEQEIRNELIYRHGQRDPHFEPSSPQAQMRLDEGVLQIRERLNYTVVIENRRGQLQEAIDEFVHRTLEPFRVVSADNTSKDKM